MARIRLETEISKEDFMVVRKIADMFPEYRAALLGHVGAQGRWLLYDTFFRGQELTYKGITDNIGRRKVSHTVMKRAVGVKIRSYPLNFFEKGRNLRSGRKEPAKRILTKKFRPIMNAYIPQFIRSFEYKYGDGIISKALKK